MSEVGTASLGGLFGWIWSSTQPLQTVQTEIIKCRVARAIDVIACGSCKFALTPHERKMCLFMTAHYSIQLAHMSASGVVTVVRDPD